MIRNKNCYDTCQTHGYVYVIKCEKYYKIGRTTNLKSRFSYIGVQIPFDIEIVHSIKCKDMLKTEELFHQLFKDKRIQGEWFNLTKEDINFIKECKYPDNIKKSIGDGFPIHIIPDMPIGKVSDMKVEKSLTENSYEYQVFTPNEVAEILKIHAQTVRKWVKEGKIKASKIGCDIRITGNSINKFIAENEIITENESNGDK